MTKLKVIPRIFIPICVGIMAACTTSNRLPQAYSQETKISQSVGGNGYRWANVAIGGGGFVTGVYPHPLEKDLVYIRTDVGGFYRWNAASKSWIPLTDKFTIEQANYYGGEGLAVDPNNPNILYIAAGKYPEWKVKGSIFKSSDRGKTWQKLNIDLPMSSNGEHRWAGERLAVDPVNSNNIFFGSRYDGLWKSADAGATWAKVTSFSANLTRDVGIVSILFDKKSPGVIYASAFGDGIYKSTDTGATWSKIEGSPNQPQRIAINDNGVLYVTQLVGVSKYENNAWKNITPSGNQAAFNALAVNPTNSNEIIVAFGQSVATKIYRSLDGGNSWTEKKTSIINKVPWWEDSLFTVWASDIVFDPKVPGKVWLTNGFGIWQTDNINAEQVVWTNYVEGYEEIVAFALAAPAKGPILLSGVGDVDGFYHHNLNAYPAKRMDGIVEANRDTFGIGYSESDPLQVVRVGGARWNSTYSGATSKDGGLTWTRFASFPANTMPLRVAVSATTPNLYVVAVSKGQHLRTTDGGASWSPVSGLPNGPEGPWYWGQPLVADKVDGNTFYYYSEGKVYRSTDGGASFEAIDSSLPNDRWQNLRCQLKTIPGFKDEVWLSLDWGGLFRSIDGGKTFSKLTNVERAHLFAFGKPLGGSTTPALYLYGKVTGMGEGIFRSLDRGQTWVSIGSQQNPIGNEPVVMEGSWQQFGLVFIGTGGRGIFSGSNDGNAASSVKSRN